MKLGNSQMKISAIGGDMYYTGNSTFMLRDNETNEMKERKIDRIGMIAAGSGITPMFQLIQTVTANPLDATSLSLIYSNRTPVSIPLLHSLCLLIILTLFSSST